MCSAIYFARPRTTTINKTIIKWGLIRPTAPPVVPTMVDVLVGVVLVASGDVVVLGMVGVMVWVVLVVPGDVVVVLVVAVEVVGVVVHI